MQSRRAFLAGSCLKGYLREGWKGRLQATSLGYFWTAKGTGHALLPSHLVLKDNLFLYRHPRAGTSNNFETLLLRESAKMLHKVKHQRAAQGPRRTANLSKHTRNPVSLEGAASAFVLCGLDAPVCFSL